MMSKREQAAALLAEAIREERGGPFKCENCDGTGHYQAVHPHCEPCRCDWTCWDCSGTGSYRIINGCFFSDPKIKHHGQRLDRCRGCRRVR